MFSTVSYTIDSHYCGDQLVSRSLIQKAVTCGMEIKKETSSTCTSILKSNCCRNETSIVKGQKELQNSFFDLSFTQQAICTTFTISYLNLFEGLENTIVPFKDYRAPLVVKSIHKIDEVYII
ncbi:hypothetical protein NBRC110019_02700 [Neptunitalea chrysea]|uniref:Uncharacterized protein n=2 Tax=Neptunitalea chrysea TaxID=1647581 RepID=A0A9W6EU45_9FLAO|nr:hypothetical protein NBRC110019_02700 [Neptunitalea chrysea]